MEYNDYEGIMEKWLGLSGERTQKLNEVIDTIAKIGLVDSLHLALALVENYFLSKLIIDSEEKDISERANELIRVVNQITQEIKFVSEKDKQFWKERNKRERQN